MFQYSSICFQCVLPAIKSVCTLCCARAVSRLAINVAGLTRPGGGLDRGTESVLHREDEHG